MERAASFFMMTGLVAGYGYFLSIAARFLYPADGQKKGWLFVKTLKEFEPGQSHEYYSPAGEKIVVTRQGAADIAEDFTALSSTCPHLGCQVHWEANNDRFFCPCHSGAFDLNGRAVSGPPADAGQSLPRYPLKVENGLLFIQTLLKKI